MSEQDQNNVARGGPKNRNALFHRRQKAIAAASDLVAEQLKEPNQAAIARLMEIFGDELVRNKANDAQARYQAAQALGQEAYQPQPKGSDVATFNGEPRSPGGVLFYLMREHAFALGLDWYGLRIPSPPRDPAPEQTAPPSASEGNKAPALAKPTSPPTPVAKTEPVKPTPVATKQEGDGVRPTGDAPAPKPNRIKATVVGTPLGAPRPTDQPGVLQLVFDVEMSPTMPKGLPTLGRGRVVVLCTEKQYRQAHPSDGVAGRLIVEGEAATTLSTAGKPMLILVCTRITTPEIEQARHVK